MVTLDKIIALAAPHQCIACGSEGSVLCRLCLISAGETIPSRCAGCHSLSPNYRTCKTCRTWLSAYSVFVGTQYDGVYEELIQSYKFHLHRDAARPISKIMRQSIEFLPDEAIICPVPTAPSRIRARGFDHAKLLAQTLAGHTERPYQSLLGRKSNVRQLGSSRMKRITQMEQEFYLRKSKNLEGKTILIVDDVMTTGATVAAASRTLKEAGAKRVYAVVFAQKL